MKKSMMLFLVLLVLGSASMISGLAMDAPIPRFADARVLGMGNVQGPVSKGVSALFTNPAGIVRQNELRPMTYRLGGYMPVTPEVLEELNKMLRGTNGYVPYEDPQNDYEEGYNDGYLDGRGGIGSVNLSNFDFEYLFNLVDLSNGFGVHASAMAGAAYAGFGAAFQYSTDFYLEQEMPSSPIMVKYFSEATAAGGGSVELSLAFGKLYVGADVRRVIQIFADYDTGMNTKEEFNSNGPGFEDIPAYVASDIGIGVGAIFEAGPLIFSLHAKTFPGLRSELKRCSLHDAIEVLGDFSEAGDITSLGLQGFYPRSAKEIGPSDPLYNLDYRIPSSVTAGAGFDVQLGRVLGVAAAASYEKVFYREERNKDNDTLWKNLHLGTEVDLFDSFKVRGGINQGYFTGGVGVSVLRIFNVKLDFNATYYSREFGSFAGHRQSESLLLEIGLRI